MGKKGKKKNKGPDSGDGDSSKPGTSQQQQQVPPPQPQRQQQQQVPPPQPQRQQQQQQLSQQPSEVRTTGKKKGAGEEYAEGDTRSRHPQQAPQQPQPQLQQQAQKTEEFPELSQQQPRSKKGKKKQRQQEYGGGDTRREEEQSFQQRQQEEQAREQAQRRQREQQASRQPQQGQQAQRQPQPNQQEQGRGRGRAAPPGFPAGRGRPPPGFQSLPRSDLQAESPPPSSARVQQQTQFQQPADTVQASPGRRQPPQKAKEGAQRISPPTSKGDKPMEQITKGMSTLMETSLIPRRIAEGRPNKEGRGRRTKLETNHLALGIDIKTVVYHYDVIVTPDRPFKFYRPALEEMQRNFYPNQFPAFDGKKNLYSYRKLPTQNAELTGIVNVWDERRDETKEVEVTIKFANSVSFSTLADYVRGGSSTNIPQEAIQALDIILRSPAATNARFVPVGRSYFSPPNGEVLRLGDGYDLWYGFYQSAIIGWKPFLNIDVAHKGFPAPDHCLDHLCDFLRVQRGRLDARSPPDNRGLGNFRSFIKDLRIVYDMPRGGKPQKRTYKVLDLSECPRNNSFMLNDRRVTVEQYFREEYNYRIMFPLVPCLKCGSVEKPIALPMELCSVLKGQPINKKLNENQTRNMVKAAAVPPHVRRKRIDDSIREIPFANDRCVREFGITVATQFTEVDARILNPPQLLYQNGRQVNVDKGVWRSGTFIKSNPLKKWAVLNTDQYVKRDQLEYLARNLQENGRQLGMDIANPVIQDINNPRDIERLFGDWKKKDIELAVVIIPERGSVTYARVKQIAEQQVGVLTQCLKSQTLRKLSQATVTNILLKINSKHNGINHNITCGIWLKYFSRPVIVFGADVTHPSPGQQGVPSVAAVAASYEPKAFSYNMEWRFQPPREEIIIDLEQIVKQQLLMFYRYNRNLKPERIFFYRDGVSEGQFQTVLEREVQAVRRACRGLDADYKPPITFLVVQKRHHTRFFPRPEDADGKTRNVPAGTVVDTTITHRNEIDFYLVSHASIQGTSRPTKYHVLWDDSNMSEDDIEEITYYLCHLFTRCTRAVSYPAPTYYSHLAAFRIRSYYEGRQGFDVNALGREQDRSRVNADLLQRSPMYFI